MKDLEIILPNQPGMLARLGEILGSQGISLEGGGVFSNGTTAIAHFLVDDAEKAKELLSQEPFIRVRINEVLIQRLKQDVPGQLGTFAAAMAEAGVNILVQYSDHAGQLIIVPDDFGKGKRVSEKWAALSPEPHR